MTDPEATPTSRPLPPRGMTLAIGSMPHRDPERATDLILRACPEAPCWAQLPGLGFRENMMAQFSEGIPCLQVDEANRKLSFAHTATQDEELAVFYERCFEAETSGDYTAFAVSDPWARGLPVYEERLRDSGAERVPFAKGQVTGPLTFGLSVLDEGGLPSLFDDTFSDVVRKAILMKALWQVQRLRPLGRSVILFVDEPILAAFGSAAFINLTREQAVAYLSEVFTAVRSAGCLVGSHCCANTDWSLMVEAGVDIINFDAYAYLDSVGLYPEAISRFLTDGGLLAWGLVPSHSLDARPAVETLLGRLEEGIGALSDQGIPRPELERNLLLTTSCGLGTLTETEAESALEELRGLGTRVREARW